MDAIDLIKQRRSVSKLTEKEPDRSQIEQLLDVAVLAPNHYMTEPWRFIVLQGDGRERLADLWEQNTRQLAEDAGRELTPQQTQVARAKAFRSPVVITVICSPGEGAGVIESEEISAVSAAVQNILLAAEALGLACKWRTGAVAYDPAAREIFQLEDGERIIAFLYLGYAAERPEAPERAPASEKTLWWDTA